MRFAAKFQCFIDDEPMMRRASRRSQMSGSAGGAHHVDHRCQSFDSLRKITVQAIRKALMKELDDLCILRSNLLN